jgi:1-acyl-sn-glycerol-3-phosphate acyltransferase
VTLGLALAVNILHYWSIRIRGPIALERRALWLHAACRRVMAAIGVRSSVEGAIPRHGLVVSNHLGYIDILIYGAVMPCFFVSKAEVRQWPHFGWAAQSGGALFLDRARRASATAAAQGIAERLSLAVPVLFFPEGTSADGSQLLPFHTALFEPAILAQAPVTAAAIRYSVGDGSPERDLCWYADMLFLPHLWKVLGTRGFTVQVQFAKPRAHASRREAAEAAHAQIAEMRSAAAPNPSLSSGD